jgi:signal transduction histidine kinase
MLLLFKSLFTQQTTNVTLQLKWKHQFQFAGYYAAIEKGFYQEQNIHVNLLEAIEGQNPSHAVFDGHAEFGVSTSDILLIRAENNSAVVLATIFQHSPQILLASKESGIEHIHDLIGKRIAMEPNAADIIAYLNDENVTLDKCIIDHHSFHANGLINGDIDAISAYLTDEPFVLNEANLNYTIISPLMGGIDFYGDVLFTTEELIKNNPILVDKFRQASLKGWKYAMENQQEIAELIYDKYSKRHSLEHLLFEANHMEKLVLANIVELGYTNPGRWKSIADTYKKLNMLDENFSNDGLLYADYLKSETKIPWKLISIFLTVIIFVSLLTYYFYNTSRKLLKAQQKISNQNEKLKKINAEKDTFFTIIAHDLKNFLSSIIGFSELLILKVNDGDMVETKDYANVILNSSNKATDLLLNLMEWSQSQTGRLKFNPETYNLDSLIAETLSLFNEYSKHKSINLVFEDFKETFVYADKHMISTVLRNLISNAIKYSKQNSEVVISLEELNEQIKVQVKDNGVGISTEMKNKIFTVGENVTTLGTESEKGTGLGLILCSEFIKKHGGEIWVDSEVEKGSTFSFTIPVKI